MPFQYTNRRGQVYHLQSKKRANGDERYSKMMRFVLTDAANRLFDVQRWCFLGSIENWHFLEASKPLASLLKKYVPHLGKESFFELI